MMPPFYEQIANAANEYEGTFARGFELQGLKELASQIDEISKAIAAEIAKRRAVSPRPARDRE